MGGKILKEIFILILLFVVVIFTIGILFYEFIPENIEEVSSIKYEASDRVLEIVAEIQEKTGINNSIVDDATGALLKSYSITKSDLTDYKTKNYYESGKKDPFAEYSDTVDEEVVSTTEINKEENKGTNLVANQTTTNAVLNTVTNTNSTATNKNNTTSSVQEVKPNTNTSNNNLVSNITNNDDKSKEDTESKNQNTTQGTYFEKKNSK